MANHKPAKPKLKTSKTAAARFSVTGTGKIMRTQGTRRARNKRTEVLNDRMEMIPISKTVAKRVRRLIPYGA